MSRLAGVLAALGGAVLLRALFLPWYDEAQAEPDLIDLSANAWQYFDLTDIALAAAAAVAIAVPLARRRAFTALAAAACALAAALIVFRMFDRPGPLAIEGLEISLELGTGPWVALAGALLASAGSLLSLRRPA